MFCHGELARLKPDPAELTSFYFLSSLGSVAGAAFVAILAPQIFSGFYELHVGLGFCALLVILVHRRDPRGGADREYFLSRAGRIKGKHADGAEFLWRVARER